MSRRTPETTNGPHERVLSALRQHRRTLRQAALTLPAHFTHLHKITQGKRQPDLELAVEFERQYGVRVEEWPALRPGVEALLRLRGAA